MNAPVIERLKLMHEELARNFSYITREAITQIIEKIRINQGHSQAEKKAREIRELIESGVREKDLLHILNQMLKPQNEEVMRMELRQTQKTLLYGLKLYKVAKEDAEALAELLEEEDQLLLIHYMKTHPNATPQEILNESDKFLEKRSSQKVRKMYGL